MIPEYINIFDTHAHYTDDAFNDDRDALLSSIRRNGVRYIMLAVSDIDDSLKALEISRKYPHIYCACGVHPECIATITPDYLDRIKKIAADERVRAIGEIGLDYHYENTDRELMIKIFSEQLMLADELGLPAIIHSRDATEDTLDVLRRCKPKKGVVHCFSGSVETAEEILKLGLHISFTGVITFNNARRALEVLKIIPLDRLMLETDCPYMAPVPWRGKRCDSSMISETAKKAAEIKGIFVQEMLDITCENGKRFFGISE